MEKSHLCGFFLLRTFFPMPLNEHFIENEYYLCNPIKNWATNIST